MRLTIRAAVLAGATTLALFALSGGQALANHVSCGDTITQDTKLDSDLVNCPGDGIVIGADNITLDLNGHTIDGVLAQSGQIGVNNTAGHTGVTVEKGTIQEFLIGVRLDGASQNLVTNLDEHSVGAAVLLTRADNNEISKNSVDGGSISLYDDSDSNLIQQNELKGGEIFLTPTTSLLLVPTANQIEKNTIHGGRNGILLVGARDTRIEKNNLFDISREAAEITDQSARTQLLDNSIVGNGVGVLVATSAAQTTIVRNQIDQNAGDGVTILNNSFRTLVERNSANGNGDDGIDSDTPQATLTRNVANNNADLGIEAVPGVIDGGGNKASGNGNPAQCINVACK